jgi:hypothetical protein
MNHCAVGFVCWILLVSLETLDGWRGLDDARCFVAVVVVLRRVTLSPEDRVVVIGTGRPRGCFPEDSSISPVPVVELSFDMGGRNMCSLPRRLRRCSAGVKTLGCFSSTCCTTVRNVLASKKGIWTTASHDCRFPFGSLTNSDG